MRLLEHARGMFRWVQVWLDILLPALDDRNTIRRPENARTLLEQLEHDVTHTNNAYQLLRSGYQRLWDFNDLPEYREQRIRLFQIVLGAFEPQRVQNLRDALRIQGSTYDQALTTKIVERLYSNFLYEDSAQKSSKGLRFVHESARRFILELDTTQVSNFGDDKEGQLSDRNNHLTIAELYIDVIGFSTHPMWQANNLEPSNWTEMNCHSPEAYRLLQDRKQWIDQPTSFLVYLATNGLRHCALAARKRSMFDAVWSKVLDRVILDPGSAFGFIVLVETTLKLDCGFPGSRGAISWVTCKNSCLLGQREGRVHLLYSHALALLNIIHEDDVSRLQLVTEKPSGAIEEDPQRRLRCLFKHTACVGGDIKRSRPFFNGENKATAVHLACRTQNRAAVDMMLQSTKFLSDNGADTILLTKTEDYDFPIGIAMWRTSWWQSSYTQSQYEMVKTLLKFERYQSCMTSVENYPDPAAEPLKSKQWSLLCDAGKRDVICLQPAPHLAVKYFEEDQMCDLLDVARPEDINIRGDLGYTVLHEAAEKGFLKVAGELVEKYGADIEGESMIGLTPSLIAYMHGYKELIEYFKAARKRISVTVPEVHSGE